MNGRIGGGKRSGKRRPVIPGIFPAERIVKHKHKRGRLHYLVKWLGWPSRYNTWEPETNILDPQLVSEYQFRTRKSHSHECENAAAEKGGSGGRSSGSSGSGVSDDAETCYAASEPDESFDRLSEAKSPSASPASHPETPRDHERVTCTVVEASSALGGADAGRRREPTLIRRAAGPPPQPQALVAPACVVGATDFAVAASAAAEDAAASSKQDADSQQRQPWRPWQRVICTQVTCHDVPILIIESDVRAGFFSERA